MAAKRRIDFSRFTQSRAPEHEDGPIQHLRPQAEKEARPSTYQRKQEQEGRSNWTGGVWAGRVDRSR